MSAIEKRNANSIDFPMYEELTISVKNVPCLSSFKIYRDQIQIPPLNYALAPYVEMARNILTDAAMQYDQTGAYTIISDQKMFIDFSSLLKESRR